MSPRPAHTVGWLAQPHHDGSGRYVSDLTPRLGGTVDVLLRVPLECDVETVHVRTSPDGEQQFAAARLVRTTDTDAWWSATLTCHNPVTNYRFLLGGGPTKYAWLNGTGMHVRDVPDASDFRLVAHDSPPPAWARGAVVYQIFPDRFARSRAADRREQPAWAVPAQWGDPVDTRPGVIAQQLYGGDLDGVVEHLDHLEALGVDVVYFTPFFPARSNHRYDAASFTAVDPLLGGDAALRRLTKAAHSRGMKVMGDFTTNHTGDAHEWFVTASGPGGRRTPERGYYIWEDGDYVGWLGVRSLPKLNHLNQQLRTLLFERADGVVRKWLGRSGGLDGWRVDVANMTGRWRGTDVNHDVARQMRDAMGRHAPEALLVGEHVHDYTVDVPGDGWHGVMNYAGFCKPVWTWLRDAEGDPNFLGAPVPVPLLDAGAVVETMRDFTSRIPWQSLVSSFNLVGSHDATRVRTLVGGDGRGVDVAAGLLFTLPSMPMLTYGDEIGMEGAFGEDGRRPMPWNEQHWDTRILEVYRSLIAARRGSVALREGGLRWVHADGDAIVFLRETADETALVHVARAAHAPITLDARHLPGIADGRPLHGPRPRVGTRSVTLSASGPGARVWAWRPTDGGATHGRRRRR
ncbi:glycoside hydrolase family 13 protein [Terracoccus luteus]|uniref:Alpha-glucosidase n=1 Tax=Terracoccus luteus TaxID=53356 RepID=A0A839Q2C0_9MICO|nr:glycoside hydrolase family 13 protein [Terracoccus luteus]MBB2986781.1 alpha-glucosidase [Terracoccus luteus]MCP2172432.1 alpha-glucosidase [Terracoccus luteus]